MVNPTQPDGHATAPPHETLRRNVAAVRERIDAACGRAGRPAADVVLVAVTKYVGPEIVAALADVGVEDVGENRVATLLEKRGSVGDRVRWHMIGHLQRNKARRALPAVDVLHSGDGLRLLQVLDAEVERLGRGPLPVLVQVNVSGEDAKGGFAPEELDGLWPQLRALRHLAPAGLMTMAPFADDAEESRPVFRILREIRDEARRRGYLDGSHLSMGMSGDFETAVEEGATIVRIGRILYHGVAVPGHHPPA